MRIVKALFEKILDNDSKSITYTEKRFNKVLDEANTEHKVRLTGIDAPERGQPFGVVQ